MVFIIQSFLILTLLFMERKKMLNFENTETLYADKASGLHNEFESDSAMAGKDWRFKNFSVPDFIWHQRRKQIYGLYDDAASGRTIKAEFEPVKAWGEIKSEYDLKTRIQQKGWVKLKARITADDEAPFIPSIYGIEPIEVLGGDKIGLEAKRVFSFMEEFRQQAQKDEVVTVEGNLEEVVSPKSRFLSSDSNVLPTLLRASPKSAALNM